MKKSKHPAQWPERYRLRRAQHEPERAVEPNAFGGLYTIRDFYRADDAAARERVRKLDPVRGGKGNTSRVNFLSGMDRNPASEIGFPDPVFNVFMAQNYQTRPRLLDAQTFHSYIFATD